VTATPTRGARNQVQRLDTVVINEIFYHPPEERPGEFIELHNRGAAAADLSGFSFTDGIDFTFPGGASIAPGGYLVLAREPGVLLQNHGVSALGPYAGALSNKGENLRLVDRRGNPVDEVRYFEGGRWSLWADGRGSSLELIDPRADNAFATAWEASDESGKAEWENLSFQVANYVPAPASELHLYLVERGECLIDDVSIRRGAGANLIPNAGFESSTTGWIIGGTHVRSARTTSDRHGGVACLQVVASGKGDTLVNRIEAETSPALTAGAYDVSLWARWQRGTSLLIVHGEYSAGPYRVTPCFTCGTPEPNLSGNPLSAGLRMTIPLDLGTPGAENGARARLRAATGSTNLGPVIGAVAQNPPLPDANESVAVTARVADADGVAQVQIFHRTGSAAGAFQSSPLADDGLHGDGESGDGVYGGGLPGYASGNKVVFYIEAADGLGATRRFPAQAPASTLLYLVSPAAPAGLDACRVLLDDQRTSELSTRELHSNDLVHGAFVFGSEKVYYNTGTRYRGSPWGRPSRQSLRVDFPRDDRFHRGRRDLNISKTGGGPGEGTALHLIGRNAIPGKPSPTTDYQWGRVWLNTSAMGVKGLVETIGGDFLERWYGEDAGNGPLLKAFGRFVFNDSGGLVGQSGWEGASFIYRAENPENYRGYYVHSVDQTEDDWAPLFELTRTLDRTQTPDAAFAQQVGGIVDFDAFFRVLGSRIMVTDCDGFGINNGHNGYIAYNSSTGLWGYVAFDVECSYVSGAPDLVGSADPGIQRLLTHPTSRRAYFRILSEYVNGYWTAAAAGPWLGAVQRATGYSTSGVLGQINAVGPRVRSLVAPFQSLPFRIVTNSGNDMTVSTATVALEGEAPIAVETIFWRRGDGEFEALSPAWTTPGRWQAIFPLPEERNELTFIGFDSRGSVVGSTDIIVTTTFRPAITLASLTPAQGPASGGTRVTVRGGGFIEGMLVRFGGVEATDVALTSAAELQATTPAAPVPLPPGGVVDVDVQYAAAAASLPRAFTYSLEGLFIRGNANGDGVVDVSDAVRVLRFLFGGPAGALGCVKSADADDSGAVNITDALRLLNALFLGGPAPPAPYPACGFDLTADGLDCEVPPGCGA
jgi:hypothetical protein